MSEFPETNTTELEFAHIGPVPAAQDTPVLVPDRKFLFLLKFHDI